MRARSLLLFAGLWLAAGTGCEARRPEQVVLVTVDTLRADHLGTYGYPRDTSPFLDSLAEESAVFERALSTSATTGPAHASLFTGRLPLHHGVRSNHQRLRPDLPTLAELMSDAGYETAAFVSTNTHFPQSELDRGFQTFDRPTPRAPGRGASRSAHETAAAAAAWLAERPGRPVFLWVHLFDPHTPYRSPPFEQDADASRTHARFLVERGTDLDFFAGSERHLLEVIDLYDGEVARVDVALAELHRAAAESAGGRALWVVTSDHGEGLGHHGWLMHGAHVYNEQLRVPLLVWDGDGALRRGRVGAPVSLVDLLPTLLELAAIAAPPSAVAWPGASLAPLLRGGDLPARGPVLSERRHFKPGPGAASRARPAPPRTPAPFSVDALIREAYRTSYEPGEKYTLQDERYKYIWHSLFEDELYDLRADPYERENLIGRGLPAEERLRSELFARVAALKSAAPGARPIAPESREALRELGYAE